MVGSFVLVWIQFELGQLGIFVNYFVDSLGWLLQGEFVVFGCRFRLSLCRDEGSSEREF